MWKGFFALGGVEIGNTSRAIGYQRTSDCPIRWIDSKQNYLGLASALGDEPYVASTINLAPWYDPDEPDISSRILGFHIMSMEGLNGSTQEAEITQRITAGASLGRTRHASRSVKITGLLTAAGRDALAAGDKWLSNALSIRACGIHETACRLTDFQFFVDEPPTRESFAGTDEEHADLVNSFRRYMHSVKVVSGPTPKENLSSRDDIHFGTVYEFTVASEEAHVYTHRREVEVPPTLPTVVQDIPYNLTTRPSAERTTGAAVVVAVNLSPNPSLETNGTDWSAAVSAVSGSAPAGYFTSGRIAGELAAVGTAAWRTRILGNGATTASGRAEMVTHQEISLVGEDPLARVSFSEWVAVLGLGGATGAAVVSVTVEAEWRDGATPLSLETIGTSTTPSDFSGRAYSLKSRPIPEDTTNVRVYTRIIVDWSSSATPANNSDLRAYIDALAVTIP